ncbi:MAG: hypothetical protein CMJ05_04170 [Pelagibacterales bacterium]|nr:hypothetical protein [Pelagibacterales bacterium]|tara:strand:- start:118 stop:474 length:357 start_codon:yes stop_codon:yes gene_type:complete
MVDTYKNFNPKLEKFSEYLKNFSGKLWNEATNHKFTNELKNDKLEDHIFKKYIIQDYIFVETLVTLIGKAVYISPNMTSKIKWANFLYVITVMKIITSKGLLMPYRLVKKKELTQSYF